MIKKYTKKDGSTAYMFKAYLGIDPITNKQRHTTRRGFKTMKDAKLELAKLQTDIQQNGLMSNDVVTFQEVYELWLEGYQNTVKASTLYSVENWFELHILPHFAHLKIKKISVTYCQRFVNELSKYYANFFTIVVYIKKVLEYAIKLNIITNNVMANIQIPKKTKKTVDKVYYEKSELATILDTLEHSEDKQLYTVIRILAFTGIRINECLALNWSDIDFTQNTIHISKTVAFTKDKLVIHSPKTKTSERTITIDKKTANIIKLWQIQQRKEMLILGYNTSDKNQLCFTTNKNNILCSAFIRTKWTKFTQKNNIPYIKLHGFRHTHCSLLFESGASIQEVQNRLGHSDIKTTMDIYAHVTKNQLDSMAEKFQQYINF
ncbi:tyrosine-type recombinase/integrase [Granulicatella sp. zg-ZJ]|uniref:site-specific integrase n=1 Tax=Granulicatella sp. zg-ZJ TaxID=2678504 RepID=UPI0013D54C73|nr:site-specific integrase [Granulicatella sp. zg-ZJ]NEW62623.1 tyrosine-type recombinase/integrase [Granulicatella sp. zg-ZJ]